MTNGREQTGTRSQLPRSRRAFTIIELVTSVGILTLVIFLASVVFNLSIESHRTAGANAEIMRKLRAITDQLNLDFKGLEKDAPLLIWFEKDPGRYDPNRYDQIMFFANGDFQSTQLYDNSGMPALTGIPIRGNLARIHYAQAQNSTPQSPYNLLPPDRMLARRRHILTADIGLDPWPNAADVNATFSEVQNESYKNEFYEHDSLSLSNWKKITAATYNTIIGQSFDYRPFIDMNEPNTFHKLICEGLGSFTVQWAYPNPDVDEFYWFPGDDPNSDGYYEDNESHFDLISPATTQFGVLFNVPGTTATPESVWYPISDENIEYKTDEEFPPDFYPRALKFTFRLYDSRGILENGRTFTHIVYLGD